ncbi:hypothetical protein [Ktedonospora formicarum]|uniref:Uncharacterized protein n=1 Tax=Ktedonospora formicarum TaxID=2778364 RepID=A0A8J3I4A3_9CHLR|nr:hypothetical protein [Ktedonospora formicarum]GHO45169.1 hypothetical protein KSX_33320 [Ktedonospora formicarum]
MTNSQVHARVIYDKLPGKHIQLVCGIQRDKQGNCFVGWTCDKRTQTHRVVYAVLNHGPFYQQRSWQKHCRS